MVNGRLAMDIEEPKQQAIKIKEALEFERLITELSSEFINISANEVDEKVTGALSRIGTFMNVDRSFLFRFNWDKTQFRISHLWEGEGVQRDEEVRGLLVREFFPWLANYLLEGKDVVVPEVEELSKVKEARTEYEYCRHIGIQSFIIIPIQVVDSPLCAIGFDSIHTKRKWTADVRNRLSIIGEIFANTIQRKHAEIELQNAYDTLEKKVDERTRDLQEALSNVKTLSGLLPICSHCKKIRDDKGYWNQIEVYIKDHSEAEFSHSICQECAKKHYPDLDIQDD